MLDDRMAAQPDSGGRSRAVLAAAREMIAAVFPAETLETLRSGVLTVGVSGERPTDWAQDGKPRGVHAEVRALVADLLGIESMAVATGWGEQVAGVAARAIDVPGLGTQWTPDRAQRFGYTQPFQYYALGLVDRRPAREAEDGTARLSEWSSRRIGQLSGCGNEDEVVQLVGRANFVAADDFPELAVLVRDKGIDGFLYDLPNAQEAIRCSSDDKLRVRPIEFDPRYPLSTGWFANHLIFRKEAVRLRAAADLALDALKASGALHELDARYGFGEELRTIA